MQCFLPYQSCNTHFWSLKDSLHPPPFSQIIMAYTYRRNKVTKSCCFAEFCFICLKHISHVSFMFSIFAASSVLEITETSLSLLLLDGLLAILYTYSYPSFCLCCLNWRYLKTYFLKKIFHNSCTFSSKSKNNKYKSRNNTNN